MDVDTVQQRTGDAFLILGHCGIGAGAGFDRVIIISARAGVHGSHELVVGRDGERALRAADGDHLILQRLPQDFENPLTELRELIQKEHPAVSQGDLAGMRPVAAAHQPGVAYGVMGRTEWAAP